MGGDDLDAFNLTVLGEDVSKVITGVGVREVLDEEVALLLGVLESCLLALDLSLSLLKRESWLNIESMTVYGLAMKVIDGVVSALRSVELVIVTVVADESEWLLSTILVLFLHDDATLDVTILAEESLELLSSVLWAEVFYIDVVINLASLTWVLWLIPDHFEIAQLG